MAKNNKSPYDFKQYWSGTGRPSTIKNLAENNIDPTESYEVLLKAKTQEINFDLLELAHSIKDKFIPLPLLLFNTGYFSLKRLLDNIVLS